MKRWQSANRAVITDFFHISFFVDHFYTYSSPCFWCAVLLLVSSFHFCVVSSPGSSFGLENKQNEDARGLVVSERRPNITLLLGDFEIRPLPHEVSKPLTYFTWSVQWMNSVCLSKRWKPPVPQPQRTKQLQNPTRPPQQKHDKTETPTT